MSIEKLSIFINWNDIYIVVLFNGIHQLLWNWSWSLTLMQTFRARKTGAWTKYSQILVALFWIIVKAKSCHYVLENWVFIWPTVTNHWWHKMLCCHAIVYTGVKLVSVVPVCALVSYPHIRFSERCPRFYKNFRCHVLDPWSELESLR